MEKLEEQLQNKSFNCPICDRKCDIRMSCKIKPYIVCDDCGVQLFIRNEKGISRLIEKIEIFDSW